MKQIPFLPSGPAAGKICGTHFRAAKVGRGEGGSGSPGGVCPPACLQRETGRDQVAALTHGANMWLQFPGFPLRFLPVVNLCSALL
jgi:hypothetical protein